MEPVLLTNHDTSQLSKYNIVDFPCPLRDGTIPKSCQLKCKDYTCSRAKKICNWFIECTHIIYNMPRTNVDLTGQWATLKHEKFIDSSYNDIKSNIKWNENQLNLNNKNKKRIYFVASYGGSGSKMLSGWLTGLKNHVKTVFHVHDRDPLKELHEKRITGKIRHSKNDYRTWTIQEGGWDKNGKLVSNNNIDDYRVIFLYKDPVEAMISRFGHGHCVHIQGDCGEKSKFPKLHEYGKNGIDLMKLHDHFNAYINPKNERNYPIIAINYHKIWDNLPALMEALGLPIELKDTFPPRSETVRNDKTGARENNLAHTEETRQLLHNMYDDILDQIDKLPAIKIV